MRVLIVLAVSGTIVACTDGNKRFDPQDRTTVNMSPEAKDLALNNLKQSGAFIDSMLYTNNVKMSVLPPASDILSSQQIENIGVRMIQMLANNGIGGLNNVPGFVLTATLSPNSSKTTSSAPQKFIVDYNITYSVVNTVTGDVYASETQKIQGIGNSMEEASGKALNQIVPNDRIASMLSAASAKIINWFNENSEVFKAQVSEAEARNDYALALALIQSVPQQASSSFAYAQSRRKEIENKFMNQIAGNELIAMKQAIYESNNEPSADVYAHFSLIPTSASCYSEAKESLKKYEKDVEVKRKADSEQQKADLKSEREYRLEMAKIESNRIKAKYEAQASEQAIRLYLSQNSSYRGFWSNLGARIIGAIDGTNWQFRVKEKPYTED